MLRKLDHIGLFVKDMETTLERYREFLGVEAARIEEMQVEGAQVTTAFLPIGDVMLEIVSSTDENGPVTEFLRERGEGIHHLAYRVEDIAASFKELSSGGLPFLWGKIVDGAHGSRVAMLKGEMFNGLCIELVERRSKEAMS